MNIDQIILFAILALVIVLLIWGRWRYDLIAFAALVCSVVAGVVPESEAFSGFGHPAVIIIALVLIVTRGLSNSGAIEIIVRYVVDAGRSLSAHIAIMAGLSASLSTFMNNVGALALLMPVDIEAASKAKRSPGLTLMPLSFASILGGLVTLIGTPPNIIVAAYREQALGESFQMFDFTPVGLACATAGVIFVALVGWRLIPRETVSHDPPKELFDLGGYIAEIRVPERSAAIGKRVRELDEAAEEADAAILGLIRRGKRLPGFARAETIRKGDVLVIEAAPAAIDRFVGALGLTMSGRDEPGKNAAGDLALAEAVVTEGARIEGRAAGSLRLLSRFGVTVLGISRQGRRFRERVRELDTRAGDVLLLIGPAERLPEVIAWLGCLPLAERGDLTIARRERAFFATGAFAIAIAFASLGATSLDIALAGVCVAYVISGIVPLRQIYESVEWPVIVLLGSMIPIGAALETTGGTGLIAGLITSFADGGSAWIVLTIVMVVTMTLSDVMNNTATTVIAAPVAVEVANRLGVSPDPFLMAVAIAASCAFLTPIGHKNNTLILGPGGYRFGDYWRMGLPLEIVVVAVAVPMILLVWPL